MAPTTAEPDSNPPESAPGAFATRGRTDEDDFSETLVDVDADDDDNNAPVATVVEMDEIENQVRDRILDQAVVPSEVRKDDEGSSRSARIAGCTVVVLAVLVVIGVTLSRFGRETAIVGTAAPTPSPTALEDLFRTEADRALFDTLLDLSAGIYMEEEGGEPLALYNVSSPQFRAFQSLAQGGAVTTQTSDLTTRYALAVLYYATNGDEWSNNIGWSSLWDTPPGEDPPYCSSDATEWFWSTCNLCSSRCDGDRLDIVRLHTNNLQGTLPPELALLLDEDVSQLILNDNAGLHGTLPAALWTKGTGLLQLTIDNTKISGTIPTALGELSLLTVLSLGSTALTGTIPSSIGRLTSLESLDLSSLPSLTPQPIPEEFYNLTSLFSFDMNDAQWTGTLSSRIGNFMRLESMSFADNELTGPIPSEVGRLSLIRALELQDNRFTGTIPSTIDGLEGAIQIFVGSNNLSGTLPASLTNMTGLKDFRGNYNSLTGSFPSEMDRMTSMKTINVGRNKMTGTIPWDDFLTWKEIKSFRLTSNSFTGSLPNNPAFWALTTLGTLQLSRNDLSGSIPTTIGLSPGLRELEVKSNRLTGAIPSEIGSATRLEKIDLSNNALRSTLPTNLAMLLQLEELELDNNTAITGTVPTDMVSLQQLRQFHVAGTSMEGDIPLCNVDSVWMPCETMSCQCCAVNTTFCS